MNLRELCLRLEQDRPLENEQLLHEFELLFGHPWSGVSLSPTTNYYACLHGLARAHKPTKVLEVGVAFGMSAAALVKACSPLELYVGIDLGKFGEQLNAQFNNIDFAKSKIHAWCRANSIHESKARFFQANTQPLGKSDNHDQFQDVAHWNEVPELMSLLQNQQFDIIFIDGKHTDDGLSNDLKTFWPYLKPGGIAICDDLHDAREYEADCFAWLGHTTLAFKSFIRDLANKIDEFAVWKYPHVTPADKNGLRPFGIIQKSNTIGDDKPNSTSISSFSAQHLFIEDYLNLQTENDSIRLPDGVNRLIIDVGANEAETTFPELEKDNQTAIIAFEPLPHKWNALRERHPKLIALPFAVSTVSGVSTFHRSANDFSSSLSPYNQAGYDAWGYQDQLKVIEQLKVRTVRLDTIISRIDLEQIELVKIDAQGCDLDVVLSLGEQIKRIKSIKLEVAITPTQLYQGAATREEVIEYMYKMGFVLTTQTLQSDGKEQNLTFENTGKPLEDTVISQKTKERIARLEHYENEHKERLVKYAISLAQQNPNDAVAWTAIALIAWHYKDTNGFLTAYQNVTFLEAEAKELAQLEPCVKEYIVPVIQQATNVFQSGQREQALQQVNSLLETFSASSEALVAIATFYAATNLQQEFVSLPNRAKQISLQKQAHSLNQGTALENTYLKSNPDIAQAIQNGGFKSGWEHFVRFGHNEGRKYFDQ